MAGWSGQARAQDSAAPEEGQPSAPSVADTPVEQPSAGDDAPPPDPDLPPLDPIAADDIDAPIDPDISLPDMDNGQDGWEVAWPDMGAPLPPLPDLPPAEQMVDADEFGEDPMLAGTSDEILPPPVPGEQQAGGEALAVGTEDRPAEVASARERRYSVRLEGLDGIANSEFRSRFNGLSVLTEHDGDPANGAQINRRIVEDTQLLDRMLRNEGYYDATVLSEVRRDGERLLVVFTAQPGPQYTYDAVRLNGLEDAGSAEAARLAPAFRPEGGAPIAVGDPIIADDLVDAQAALQYDMRETGYPFGEVGEELVTIDHDVRQGSLDQPVIPGARLRFGQVIAEDDGMLGARHIQRIARFRPGEWYKWSDTEDLRRALIATGLVASVDIEPRANPDGETVDVGVALAPAPPRTIAGQVGYSSGQGFRLEASWEHRNMFPPEGALILRGIAGTREQLGSITYRRNNWLRRDRVLTAQALAGQVDSDAFEARTVLLSARVERATTLIYQKVWSWAFGVELLGTDELAYVPAIDADERRRYLIGSVFGLVTYDRSNDLLDPTRGFRLTARISPEASFNQGTFTYVRGQFDATGYLPVSDRIVLAGRARVGAIVGASRDNLAPSRRYYSGGGGSVRGYGYQRIGPLAPDNDPIGGTGLFEIAAEARIKAFGAFSIVPFVDAGNVYPSSFPDFDDITDLRVGAGVGVRYATNFGPIRVDVGTPLNPRPGDSRIAVYVSLGQAF